MNDIEYSVIGTRRRRIVRGEQIGYYAVRYCRGELTLVGKGERAGAYLESLDYTVDHLASGLSIIDASSYADAMALADELSTFSPADEMVPSEAAKSDGFAMCQEYAAYVGPELATWIQTIAELQRFVPFREWRAARTRSA